jgi:hypothetical protein
MPIVLIDVQCERAKERLDSIYLGQLAVYKKLGGEKEWNKRNKRNSNEEAGKAVAEWKHEWKTYGEEAIWHGHIVRGGSNPLHPVVLRIQMFLTYFRTIPYAH